MNKNEFVGDLAGRAGLSAADAQRAVDGFIDVVKSALAKGDTINLAGFGSFSVRDRAARSGRNPKTGETIQIPASKVPGFKAGKALKDAVS